MSVAECATLPWDAAAGGSTTGWWAIVLECFSSHALKSCSSDSRYRRKVSGSFDTRSAAEASFQEAGELTNRGYYQVRTYAIYIHNTYIHIYIHT